MPKFSAQVDLRKIPVLNIVVESSASAPTSPLNGQLWYDTSVNVLKAYQNGAWTTYAALDGSSKVALANLPVATSGTNSATQIVRADDSRLADQRIPTDGSVTGGSGAGAKIATSTITDVNVATANKDGAAATASLRTLGTGAAQAFPGNGRLDQLAAPTANVSLNNLRITNLAASVSASDAVNRAELDAARQGYAGTKDPVRVAVAANVNLAAPGTSLDGVTMAVNDRFLATAQTTTTQNGIYVYNGSASAATRATDADATGEIRDGTTVAVAEGTKAGSIYIQTATPSGAPGAWTESWVQFNTGGTAYLGGAGLVLTGNTFDVVAADTSITVNADSITVGLVPVNKGGTNSTTAAGARTNLGATGKYAQDLAALTAGVESTVTHSLGTTDVIVQFTSNTGGARWEEHFDWRVNDANSIIVKSDIAYASGAYRVVVIG